MHIDKPVKVFTFRAKSEGCCTKLVEQTLRFRICLELTKLYKSELESGLETFGINLSQLGYNPEFVIN